MHILIPNLQFPPYSSPGSIRLGRFVKRFVELGGRVSVVTGSFEDYMNGFPQNGRFDYHLYEQLPDTINIVRTEPIKPGYGKKILDRLWLGRLYRFINIPDTESIWIKTAVKHCVEINRIDPIDCIYTSSNPLSSHLIGKKVARITHASWIAEFRDPWTTNPFKSWETKLHYLYERILEGKVLKFADHIIFNTSVARDQVLKEFSRLHIEKTSIVTNGFKVESLEGVNDSIDENKILNNIIYDSYIKDTDQINIMYIGTLYAIAPPIKQKNINWRKKIRDIINSIGSFQLAEVEKLGRSPWPIIQALVYLNKTKPEIVNNINVIFIGNIQQNSDVDQFNKLVLEAGLQKSIKYTRMVSNEVALRLMKVADALVLNQIFTRDNEKCPCVPAKTYEYLAAGKPILALLPLGDAYDLVKRSGLGYFASPTNYKEIAKEIENLYNDYMNKALPTINNCRFNLGEFSSKYLADKIWEIFLNIINYN